MASDRECCENCHFWRNKYSWLMSETETITMAECHRLPPCTNGHDTYFPKVKSDNWCGEFKRTSEGDQLGKNLERINQVLERIEK